MDVEVDGIPVWKMICDRPWFKHHPKQKEWVDELKGPKIGKGNGCWEREFEFLKIVTSESSRFRPPFPPLDFFYISNEK